MIAANVFDMSIIAALNKAPHSMVSGKLYGIDMSARFVIPDLRANVEQHYRDLLDTDVVSYGQRANVPFMFQHFGLEISFARPAELHLHQPDLVMDAGLRQLIDNIGPVILKNVFIEQATRAPSHRNRFPHLNFHIDRSSEQETVYSLYSRDPFDDEQKFPRKSSTLFVPNLVAYLQAVRQKIINPAVEKGMRTATVLFEDEDVNALMGKIIVEHRWDEPQGVGEVSTIDNRTVLHSSYYRDPMEKGYKIGVRYLA